MFTRDERRAFLFLMGIAAAGGVARMVRSGGSAPGAELVAPHLAGGDIAAQADAARRAEALARPLGPGEQVDVDRADADELGRLPRVGPALARRIVADRDANGPFGSLEGLGRVPGIGEATLALLRPSVRFSGIAAPVPPSAPPASPGGARSTRAGPARDPCADLSRPLPLNRAEAAELACLPGIGPVLAGRIIEDRRARGPFAEVQALERVPGIGPALLARLAERVSAP